MNRTAENALLDLLGPEGFLTDMEDRLTYGVDASRAFSMPDAVAFPGSAEQVAAILKIADRYSLPVIARGAGSGLTGGAVPVAGGLVLVMNRLNRILEIDTVNLLAIVEPGVVTATFHAAVERFGLFYPPDPSSMHFSTLGGNIAENAGGMRAVKYGVTRSYVMGLEVVTASGEIIHAGSKCVKDVVGYDLTPLFVGSEGTLGIITRAILRLLPAPEDRGALSASFASLKAAALAAAAVFKARIIPAKLEFMDRHCLGAVASYLELEVPAEARAMLLLEVDGKKASVAEDLARIRDIFRENGALAMDCARDPEAQERLWQSRRSVHGALQTLRPRWEEEDISVPVAAVPEMIGLLERIGCRHDLRVVCFGHLGDGNLHVSLAPESGPEAPEALQRAKDEILRAAVGLEGRIAAEHGIGLSKREKIGWNLDGPTIGLMRAVKRMMDPKGILNPGKMFPPGPA